MHVGSHWGVAYDLRVCNLYFALPYSSCVSFSRIQIDNSQRVCVCAAHVFDARPTQIKQQSQCQFVGISAKPEERHSRIAPVSFQYGNWFNSTVHSLSFPLQ